MFLKITPTTGVGRAIKVRKLSPCFMGLFQILKRIGPVAYRVTLPPHLSNLHDVFHVSQLRKYQPDCTHFFEPESIQQRDDLTFHVSPTRIVDKSTKHLRNKAVQLVKVAWGNEDSAGCTWELESDMRKEYPELFSGTQF